MEGNGTETKIYAQQRHLRPETPIASMKALQSQNMTLPRNSAMVQFISARKVLYYVWRRHEFFVFKVTFAKQRIA